MGVGDVLAGDRQVKLPVEPIAVDPGQPAIDVLRRCEVGERLLECEQAVRSGVEALVADCEVALVPGVVRYPIDEFLTEGETALIASTPSR